MLANAAALWVATWLFSGISLTGSDTLDPFGSQQPCRVRVHPNQTSGTSRVLSVRLGSLRG